MFILSGLDKSKLKETYEMHRLGVTSMNVYFHNIRALKTRSLKYINQETYKSYYSTILGDINLESAPIDTIIPNETPEEQEEYQSMFSINIEIPEYKRVEKRITLEDLYNTLPITNETHVAMKEHPEKLPELIEEVFILFVIEKYLEFIDQIHLEMVSNMTPIIEYVVENVDEKKMKSFIHTKKINLDKFSEKLKEIAFLPDYKRTKLFYLDAHDDVPVIDVEKVLGMLITNTDTPQDLIIVASIYMILSFSMVDIVGDKLANDDIPHVKFIKDVLTKIC